MRETRVLADLLCSRDAAKTEHGAAPRSELWCVCTTRAGHFVVEIWGDTGRYGRYGHLSGHNTTNE